LAEEERYKKYAVVGTFDQMPGWVLLGDSKGQVKLFNVDNYEEVSPSHARLTSSHWSGLRWIFS
jgi:hypothetical protein